MIRTTIAQRLAVGAVFGAVAAGVGTLYAATLPVEGTPRPVLAAVREGATYPGAVAEDSPGWDCTMMGNRVCGPGNAQDAPAGAYDEGGVLIGP